MTVVLAGLAIGVLGAAVPAGVAVAESQPNTVGVQLAPPDPHDGCRNRTIYTNEWSYTLVKVWSPNGAFYVGDYLVYHHENGNNVPWGPWEWVC